MKVECLKEKLETAIIRAERVTNKNVTLPVLKNILLTAKDRYLVVKATNLDLGIEIKVPVKVDVEGVVAVPADVLKGFINNLSNDSKITLELKDNKLLITTNRSETFIHTYPNEEFPSIPTLKESKDLVVPVERFLSGLKSVWYSASVQSMKPELASIYIYYEDSSIVFAATDSFRLAEKKISIKKLDEFNSVLIPFKNVSDIIKIIEGVDGDISITITDNQIAIFCDDLYITSRVIDGVFPDYRQIIPKDYETEVVVLKQDIVDVLKRSYVFSDKFNRVTFEITPKDKKFIVETNNQDIGESKNEVQAAINGDKIKLSFNYKNIVDAFQSITTDSIVFKFGEKKPLMIQGIGDTSFIYITMPMNR
ncbi:DNA polymerase III subunit beta [Candidatus Campbellbacteria bacterium CG22_combo_CG10-13_8_21_14_all_36_13]|uniref:Beta sliding clamp n=1 Tax=Candidatus Campbellbacteria bacterium CG22_combo_CG10-13_8_21_14_all_36_13 TaxID=1974529 RepID=A0A2H0DZM9_9BACT|nr:MAG: DNA polymerase III subunit beta [Candidatus Campbellbacteria bacterium CG22_combo_CG10-13_8_21_14_all_36_13]